MGGTLAPMQPVAHSRHHTRAVVIRLKWLGESRIGSGGSKRAARHVPPIQLKDVTGWGAVRYSHHTLRLSACSKFLIAARTGGLPARSDAPAEGLVRKQMTPTDRLSSFGTGLATNSDSGSRVPRGRCEHYSDLGAVPIGLLFVAWLRETSTAVFW